MLNKFDYRPEVCCKINILLLKFIKVIINFNKQYSNLSKEVYKFYHKYGNQVTCSSGLQSNSSQITQQYSNFI